MAELVDARDSKSRGAWPRKGSTPFSGTRRPGPGRPARPIEPWILPVLLPSLACAAAPTATILRPAAVETVVVDVVGPTRVDLRVRGHVGDACTRLHETRVARTERRFVVTLTTMRPADAVCAQVLVPFESSVSLDVRGLPPGPYTVEVNGVVAAFVLGGPAP